MNRSFRRIIEWGLVVSLLLLLVLALAWLDSLFLGTLREPVALDTELYLRAEDGRLYLFNELGDDWKPRFVGVKARAISWVRRYTSWFFPGIEYHNRLFNSGRTIWSLDVSLVTPLVFLLFTIALLGRVWRGGSRVASRGGNQGIASGSPPSVFEV